MPRRASATDFPLRGCPAPGNRSRVGSALVRTISVIEVPLKRALFDCRVCGSCLLSQTRLICPMTCPKGLRNGPCGGTLNGMCEVAPDRPCVWMRIHGKDGPAGEALLLRSPPDVRLFGTSSFVNLFSGADAATRIPISLDQQGPTDATAPRSGLHAKLASGKPVVTVELQSPRKLGGLGRLGRDIDHWLPWVDAFNTTSGAGGHAGVSSLRAALEVVKRGGEAVVQICGRDVTPATFVTELEAAGEAGISNLLCLTGDWPADAPRNARAPVEARQRFFPMDSSQMIYEARFLAERNRSAFAEAEGRKAPRFFIGAAANPCSVPTDAVVARTWQKIACGANFVQTQVVFDVEGFCHWRNCLLRDEKGKRLYLLASIPVIGKRSALEVLETIPGILVPASVKAELTASPSIETSGLRLARSLMQRLMDRRAVHGFHLIPFGATPGQVAEAARLARDLFHAAATQPPL